MTDSFESLLAAPTPDRPLLGLTVLLVEDSRFASEAMRLLCLRSGARIRRADSLAAARKHLRVYRPNVVIVDLGLPDGSGAELIGELDAARPRVDVLLGMSGDSGAESLAREAGADGFIGKPISSLGTFQAAVLGALPPEARPRGLRAGAEDRVSPDPIALQDDFVHVADLLTTETGEGMLDYIAQFLSGVARTAGDGEMEDAARRLAGLRQAGLPYGPEIARIAGLVHGRIEPRKVV
ncbi:Response regulator receiver domain-containing protein [Celeribacter indicus]|nr:response regulator [Celeribacter indicus]SDW72710.1 Response regulator receiver domain-containing protein [Celeribacter indicus]